MKIKNLCMLLFLVLLISACSNNAESKENVGEIFNVALDTIMEHNEELNDEMEFIAINVGELEDLSEKDEKTISDYFEEKYKVDVMITNNTAQELKETELYDSDTDTLKGVFLGIEKADFKDDNSVFFEGNKYRSNSSGFALEFSVHYEDNEWQAGEIDELWSLTDPVN